MLGNAATEISDKWSLYPEVHGSWVNNFKWEHKCLFTIKNVLKFTKSICLQSFSRVLMSIRFLTPCSSCPWQVPKKNPKIAFLNSVPLAEVLSEKLHLRQEMPNWRRRQCSKQKRNFSFFLPFFLLKSEKKSSHRIIKLRKINIENNNSELKNVLWSNYYPQGRGVSDRTMGYIWGSVLFL